MERILVTGGAGFIGSCVARRLVAAGHRVTTLDLLTCPGHVESLGDAANAPNHTLVQADIRDGTAVRNVFSEARPAHDLHEGLGHTVRWYLENRRWWRRVRESGFDDRRRRGLRGG